MADFGDYLANVESGGTSQNLAFVRSVETPAGVAAGPWPGTGLHGRLAAKADLGWEPSAEGMIPNGLRHAVKTRMEEHVIPEIASETWLRHEIPAVSGAYRHLPQDVRVAITGCFRRTGSGRSTSGFPRND